MRLCIDGSNLGPGGSRTHLYEILRRVDPGRYGFERVIVWGRASLLDYLEDRPWLDRRALPVFDRSYVLRGLWQRYSLGRLALRDACDLIFSPGGSVLTDFRPVVTMSRNLLPFDVDECRRYGIGRTRLKLLLLRAVQSRSLVRASSRIFLTKFAKVSVEAFTGPFANDTTVIPHGVDERFFRDPPAQRPLAEFSMANPFRLVYVSTIDRYKHQPMVAEAVATIRAEGFPVAAHFIGGAFEPTLSLFTSTLDRLDPQRQFLRYLGPAPYAEMHSVLHEADAAVFASSCENMPNTLLEKMAAGLPIACADRGPMPEVLGDAGVYFDPESASSIAAQLRRLLGDDALRERCAAAARARALLYSWQRCADDTFKALQEAARRAQGHEQGRQR